MLPTNIHPGTSGSLSRQAGDGEPAAQHQHLLSDSAEDYAPTAGTSGEDQSLLAGSDNSLAGGADLATEPREHMRDTLKLDNVHCEPDTI